MKKSLILAGIAALMLTSSMSFAATADSSANADKAKVKSQQCTCQKRKPPKGDRPNLDDRLKLTEKQKQQAHELRMKGHEKIKPIMEKMKAKHEEIKKVAQSSMTQEQKDNKICAIEREILALKQEARKIRMQNFKEFEAILTPEQKAEFEKIKKEGKDRHKMKGPKGPHKPGFGPDGHRGPQPPQD